MAGAGHPTHGATPRGRALVVVYVASFLAATLVGFAPLPSWVREPVQVVVLAPAAWAGDRVDWAVQDWVDDTRRRLGTARWFQVLARALLDDPWTPADEREGYVGTVPAGWVPADAATRRDGTGPPDAAGPPGDGDPGDDPAGGDGHRRRGDAPDRPVDTAAWVERRLAAAGFRRNPTAYLEYRDRESREFERSSWALRSAVDAADQLHLRLFVSADGSVDLYGHREPSVVAGAAHYRPPDYRSGVRTALSVLDAAGLPLERRETVGGARPVPVGAGDGRGRAAPASGDGAATSGPDSGAGGPGGRGEGGDRPGRRDRDGDDGDRAATSGDGPR